MLKVIILAGYSLPSVKNQDPKVKLAAEFGMDINLKLLVGHLEKAFPAVKCTLEAITLDNYRTVIDKHMGSPGSHDTVFLNLCDGTEIDGYPGISIVEYLESKKLAFTGSGSLFFDKTTSKTVMKRIFDQESVPTASYSVITSDMDFEKIEYPVIVKPSVSYGSLAISNASVCWSGVELREYLKTQDTSQEIFYETFLSGR